MEQFIVSARKYRPATFDSVVGQLSIATTLKNSIKSNHIAQAYLFCGPRGVGKTTCARIFAKTINCQQISATIEACNECESCKSFNEQRSYSIHELDAASNNSVEDIRLLIEKVRIPPQVGKYSIYIIDEVHMLSAAAFNAFLKTLEEPPKHAIFILATTEKHKILPTILSRCQIFDFNRIVVEDTVRYLASIAEKEEVKYELEALNIIAQKADGAMRDALSIFDQVVSFSDNQITYKKVIDNLNVLDYDYYFRIVDHFCEGNIKDTLLILNDILTEGFDAHNFINGLAKHFRDLLVCQDQATVKLLEVGASIKDRYLKQATTCKDVFIFEALTILNQCDVQFKSARNQRLHVELAMVQLCRIHAKLNAPQQVAAPVSQPPAAKTQAPAAAKTADKAATPTPTASPASTPTASKPTMSSFSIKNAMKDSTPKESQTAPAKDDSPKDEPDDEGERAGSGTARPELIPAKYMEYIETLKNDNPRMYGTLNQKPVVGSDNVVKLVMNNSVQVDEFNKTIRPSLLAYLKKNTGVPLIEIVTEVTEYQDQRRLYTSEDRFRHLAAKNPDLTKLQQRMNLELE